MKLFNYTGVLIKYDILKHEDKKHLKRLGQYEIENKTLKQCLESESKRVMTFRGSYKKVLNDYEILTSEYNKLLSEKKTLERKLKKMEG